jgi:hypothetical protein
MLTSDVYLMAGRHAEREVERESGGVTSSSRGSRAVALHTKENSKISECEQLKIVGRHTHSREGDMGVFRRGTTYISCIRGRRHRRALETRRGGQFGPKAQVIGEHPGTHGDGLPQLLIAIES